MHLTLLHCTLQMIAHLEIDQREGEGERDKGLKRTVEVEAERELEVKWGEVSI